MRNMKSSFGRRKSNKSSLRVTHPWAVKANPFLNEVSTKRGIFTTEDWSIKSYCNRGYRRIGRIWFEKSSSSALFVPFVNDLHFSYYISNSHKNRWIDHSKASKFLELSIDSRGCFMIILNFPITGLWSLPVTGTSEYLRHSLLWSGALLLVNNMRSHQDGFLLFSYV